MVFRLISTIFVLFAYSLCASGLAIPFGDSSSGEGAGFLKLDIVVDRNYSANHGTLSKRGYPSFPLVHDYSRYFVTLNFGSNLQPIQVQIDTGSSDTWVFSDDYDSSNSSTKKRLHEIFTIDYIDGYAVGEYVTDTASMPEGPTLENFQFGDVYNGSGDGILGLSHTRQESLKGHGPHYPNFPAALKNAGYIKKSAFSIFLNDEDATTGSIIFGGIDTEKYQGSLVSHPFAIPNYEMAIILDSITTSDGNKHFANFSINLDTGTNIVYLPSHLVQNIADAAGLKYNQSTQIIDVDCSEQISGNIGFNFKNQTIEIPLQKLIEKNEFNSNCGFGVAGNVNQDHVNYLGERFLRFVYAVYNLDDNTLLLAPAAYSSDSNIVAIDS